MLDENECVSNLMLEIKGKMLNQDYDTAIERCFDMIRSLKHMKKLNMEKRAVDMLCFAAKNVLRGPK